MKNGGHLLDDIIFFIDGKVPESLLKYLLLSLTFLGDCSRLIKSRDVLHELMSPFVRHALKRRKTAHVKQTCPRREPGINSKKKQ